MTASIAFYFVFEAGSLEIAISARLTHPGATGIGLCLPYLLLGLEPSTPPRFYVSAEDLNFGPFPANNFPLRHLPSPPVQSLDKNVSEPVLIGA